MKLRTARQREIHVRFDIDIKIGNRPSLFSQAVSVKSRVEEVLLSPLDWPMLYPWLTWKKSSPWTGQSALVEVVPGNVSGVPLLKGTRLPADTVLSNYEAGSPVDEISDNFDMPEQTIRDLLTYAGHKQ